MTGKRNIGQELLDGVHAIKSGQGLCVTVTVPDAHSLRERMGLSQSAFAGLLGVSIRTLQDWEQGRRVPSGPAASLLRIADRHPEALIS